MPSSLQQVVSDPEFAKLSDDDKKAVIARIDPTFSQLQPQDQQQVLSRLAPKAPAAPVDHAARLAQLQGAQGPGPSGLGATIRDATEGMAHDVANIGIGAAKGAGHTVVSLGALAHNIPGMDTIAPDQTGAFSGEDATVNNVLKANGGWQKAGKAAEQVAEFFVPGAAEAGVLAPVAKVAGKAGLLGKMALEGLNSAGVTAAQGGDSLIAGLTGAAVPAVAAGIGKLAPELINGLIGARPKSFRTGTDPGGAIVDEGLVAPTMGGLADKVRAAKDAVGQKIGALLGTLPKANTVRANVMPLIDAPIDRAKTALAALGDTSGVARMDAMRQGLYDQFAKMQTSPSAATAAELFGVKKILDDSINHAAADTTAASAKQVAREIRRSFARQISDLVPEVAPLNKQYGSLAEAADSINEKMLREHGIGAFVKNPLNYLLGSAAGYALHNPMAAIGALAAKTAATSTPVVTAAAQAARGIGSEVGQAIAAKVGGAATSAVTQDKKALAREIMRQKQPQRGITGGILTQ